MSPHVIMKDQIDVQKVVNMQLLDDLTSSNVSLVKQYHPQDQIDVKEHAIML